MSETTGSWITTMYGADGKPFQLDEAANEAANPPPFNGSRLLACQRAAYLAEKHSTATGRKVMGVAIMAAKGKEERK